MLAMDCLGRDESISISSFERSDLSFLFGDMASRGDRGDKRSSVENESRAAVLRTSDMSTGPFKWMLEDPLRSESAALPDGSLFAMFIKSTTNSVCLCAFFVCILENCLL
jgi:hypothetical protein